MKHLTEEQKAKAAERKAKFKALWKTVAAMPELQRIQLSNKLGLVTCEGHSLSLCNQMLIALQCPGASVLGGFRQWLKHGRCVRKGEHGSMIWVPCGGGKKNDLPMDGTASGVSAIADGAPADENDTRFIIGTVFDISQTEECETGSADIVPAEAPVNYVRLSRPELATV